MNYVYIWTVIGLLLACLFRQDDDRPIIASPGLTIIFVLIWPYILWYAIGHVKRIKWKGKIIWERTRR